MERDFNSILNDVKALRGKTAVYLPSLKREVNILSLNLQQQKRIIENATDDATTLISFYTTIFSILDENIADEVNLTDLNTIDRICLLLAMKGDLDETITIDGKNVNIKEIIEKNSKIEFNIEPETIILDSISALLKPPSLKLDNEVNVLVLEKYSKMQDDEQSIKNFISDLYSFEIYKFIDNVTINDININFRDVDIDVGIQITEEMGGRFLKKVTKYINTFRALENKFLEYNGKALDITPDIFVS